MSKRSIKKISSPKKNRSESSSKNSGLFTDVKKLKNEISKLTNQIQKEINQSPDLGAKILSDWIKLKKHKKAS